MFVGCRTTLTGNFLFDTISKLTADRAKAAVRVKAAARVKDKP